MPIIRTLLMALAVLLVPLASVTHAAGSGDHGMTIAASGSMADHATHASDCCDASGQRTVPSCGIDMACVVTGDARAMIATATMLVPARDRLRDGVRPSAPLDPPRL